MVQQGDFKVELVQAQSKVPFSEHKHEGKTYVEVEPDSEYFVAVSRTLVQHVAKMVRIEPIIDDKPLKCHWNFDSGTTTQTPSFLGSLSYDNGTLVSQSFKLVCPNKNTTWGTNNNKNNNNNNKELPIGKVEIKFSRP